MLSLIFGRVVPAIRAARHDYSRRQSWPYLHGIDPARLAYPTPAGG